MGSCEKRVESKGCGGKQGNNVISGIQSVLYSSWLSQINGGGQEGGGIRTSSIPVNAFGWLQLGKSLCVERTGRTQCLEKCTLRHFTDDTTELCGVEDTLEGRDAILRDTDRLEMAASPEEAT